MVVIREATREDCLEISRLIKELAAFEKMADSPRVDPKTLERDGFDLNPPLYMSLVVEDPDQTDEERPRKLIGYTIYYIGYSTWNGKKFYIEDIMLTERVRGKGFGKQLFKRICKEAVRLQCEVMNFTVLSWNPAKEFYKSFGAHDSTESSEWHFYTLDKPDIYKAAQS